MEISATANSTSLSAALAATDILASLTPEPPPQTVTPTALNLHCGLFSPTVVNAPRSVSRSFGMSYESLGGVSSGSPPEPPPTRVITPPLVPSGEQVFAPSVHTTPPPPSKPFRARGIAGRVGVEGRRSTVKASGSWRQLLVYTVRRIVWFLDLQHRLAGWFHSLLWWIGLAYAAIYPEQIIAWIRRLFSGQE